MRNNTGFTLIEILVAVALTGVILMTGYSAFQRIMQAQARLGATIDIQKNLFYTNEKLAALIRDGGTIDYEEYFNRRMLGYAQGMRSDGVFTFTNYSHFGNGNTSGGRPPIYYCGMVNTALNPDESTWVDAESCMNTSTNVLITSSPLGPTATYHFPATISHQPYGQYAALAFNYLDPAGYPVPILLPPIFLAGSTVGIFNRGTDNKVILQVTTNVGLPELYLIKKNLDGTYDRTYFRHVYVQDPTVPIANICNPTDSIGITYCLGKIQITKLTSCDTVGTPDGVIDAWIPDNEFYMPPPGSPTTPNECPTTANTIYLSAHEEIITGTPNLPPNLVWVDVTSPDMNVVRATFLPSPLKIPELMSGSGDDTRAAQVSLSLEVNLSTHLRNTSFILPELNHPRLLITTYDLFE